MVNLITSHSQKASFLGEGIIVKSGSIYYVDILSKEIIWDGIQICLRDEIPSVIFNKIEQHLIVGTDRGIRKISKNGVIDPFIELAEHDDENFRLNDGCLLSDGSYLVGAMSKDDPATHPGYILYCRPDGTQTRFEWDCHIPTSFIELPVGSVLITDSFKQAIYKCRITENDLKRTIWYVSEDEATPDGGCIITNQRVAIAMWDGHCVRLFDFEGKVLEDIALPVPRPTNCSYDAQRRKLFITSARDGLTQKELQKYPKSGHIFWNEVE